MWLQILLRNVFSCLYIPKNQIGRGKGGGRGRRNFLQEVCVPFNKYVERFFTVFFDVYSLSIQHSRMSYLQNSRPFLYQRTEQIPLEGEQKQESTLYFPKYKTVITSQPAFTSYTERRKNKRQRDKEGGHSGSISWPG